MEIKGGVEAKRKGAWERIGGGGEGKGQGGGRKVGNISKT